MKYFKLYKTLEDASAQGEDGILSPHIDVVQEKGAVNILKAETSKFTCTFDSNGKITEVAPTQGDNEIWYTSTDGNIITPYTAGTSIFGANIVSNTYKDGQGIITFDGDITTIGCKAFYQSYKLSSITMPNKVTTIENRAFYHCSALTQCNLNNGLKSIEIYAFKQCTSLSSITIPNSVTSIGEYVFSYCMGLISVNIGSGVTSIENNAFEGCPRLSAFTGSHTGISSDNRCIGVNGKLLCFASANLTSYTIPTMYTSIGEHAFKQCTNLSSITIPNSVTSIGYAAFQYCTNLSSINIGSGVTSIGEHAFKQCTNLSSIIIDSGNTIYDSRNNCNAIINTSANTLIQGCKTTIIPDTLISIGNRAFERCTSLSSITIPNSVTNIGSYAFYYCTGMTSFTCEATTPPTLGSDAFYSFPSAMPIYVPSASVDAYKAATNWSARAAYIQAIPSE